MKDNITRVLFDKKTIKEMEEFRKDIKEPIELPTFKGPVITLYDTIKKAWQTKLDQTTQLNKD